MLDTRFSYELHIMKHFRKPQKMNRPIRSALGMLLTLVLVKAIAFAAPPPPPSGKARLILAKAQELMAQKKIEEAKGLVREYTAGAKPCPPGDLRGPCHPLIDLMRGNLFSRQGKNAEAEERYETALKKDPNLSAAWQNLARIRWENGRFEDAAKAFVRAYETASDKKPETLYFAAASQVNAGRYERALEIFTRLQAETGEAMPPEWIQTRVRAYLALGRPEPALPLIESLVACTNPPEQRTWKELLLQQYIELGLTDKALDYALNLVDSYPEEPIWWRALARLYLERKEYADALGALTVYGHLRPMGEAETALAADMNMQLGIWDRAAGLYETLYRKNPRPETIRRLTAAYRRLGDPDKALARLKALSGDNGDGRLDLLQADLLFDTGRYSEAAVFYRRAAGAGREPGRSQLMLGYAAWHQGDYAAARRALKAAATHPDQRRAAASALKALGRFGKGRADLSAVKP